MRGHAGQDMDVNTSLEGNCIPIPFAQSTLNLMGSVAPACSHTIHTQYAPDVCQ